LIEQ
jgi:hypothetical protein